MPLQAGHVLDLLDPQERTVGQMTIERRDGDLLSGTFVPGPAFATVAPLFREFEEAVNGQALGVVERLDAAIAALGLSLLAPEAAQGLEIRDVQIWTDGGISCRLTEGAIAAMDAGALSTQSVAPVRK